MKNTPRTVSLPSSLRTPAKDSGALRRVTDALRESEERYRVLYEQTPSMYFTVDVKGTVLSVNQFGAEHLGYDPSELIGKTVLGVFHDDDKDSARRCLETCLARPNEVHRWELRKVRKDGAEMRVKETARAIVGPDGSPLVLVVCEDITERWRAEEALRIVSEQTAPQVGVDFFQSLVRHLAEALHVRFAFICELCQEDPQRVRTLAWWTGAECGENFEYALRATPCEGVFEQDGAYYPREVQQLFLEDEWLAQHGVESYLAVPLQDRANNLIGHLGLMHAEPMGDDLPREKILRIVASRAAAELERARAEETLRRHEQMVSASTDLMAFIDRTYTYQTVNTAYAQAIGKDKKEILGRHVTEIMGQQTFESRLKPHLDRCLSGKHVDYQDWMHLPGRGRRFLDAHYDPFFGPNGVVSGIVADIRDITEWKQTETRLRQHEDQLRTLASEMSLTEERERHRIAANLHDGTVQNLALSRIKTGALRKLISSEEGAVLLHEIQALIDQTIRDTRSLVFELSPPILYELGFEPALEWLAEQAETRYTFACEVQSDKQSEPLDKNVEVVLFQAVRELLANVGKHANATQASVRLCKQGEMLTVCVEDNGLGFNVAAVAPGAVERGGFGLFSIEERLAMLGGRLEIDSVAGRGTRVTLKIPLRSNARA